MNVASERIKRVKNGAASIAFRVHGPSEDAAPTVCLIASTGRGPGDFAHLSEHLAAFGVRVVLPWPRGTGGSTGDLSAVDFHDLAADAAAALEAEVGHGPVVVAGHAYGCWIARTMAADRPDLIDGIALLAAAAGTWPQELSRAIDVAMSSNAPETERLAALRLAFFTGDHDPRPWLDGWSPALALAQREAKARSPRERWWHSGTVPILDIVGRQDPFRPEPERDFYVREFGARVLLKTLDGASHALPDELPRETATVLADWIGRLPRRTNRSE